MPTMTDRPVRWATVASADPLTVQFPGDVTTTGADIGLQDVNYPPVMGERVWLVELAEGQWLLAGRVVRPGDSDIGAPGGGGVTPPGEGGDTDTGDPGGGLPGQPSDPGGGTVTLGSRNGYGGPVGVLLTAGPIPGENPNGLAKSGANYVAQIGESWLTYAPGGAQLGTVARVTPAPATADINGEGGPAGTPATLATGAKGFAKSGENWLLLEGTITLRRYGPTGTVLGQHTITV